MPSHLQAWRSSGGNAAALVVCLWSCTRARAADTDVHAPAGAGRGPAATQAAEGGSYILERSAGGGYVHHDPRFDAHIARDGQVTFDDHHIHSSLLIFGLPLLGPPAASAERPSLQRAISDWRQPKPKRPIPFSLPESPDFADPMLALPIDMRRPLGPMLLTVPGTFDLTDELMLMVGQGWYRYEKAKFLSATFEFRLKMAVAEHRRLLRTATAELPDRLDALWADAGYAPREKRRILFLLWAEVDAGGEGTRGAVEAIESWIRRRLPAGTPLAYSAIELSECQSQSVGRAFAPYGAPSDGGVVDQRSSDQRSDDAIVRDAARIRRSSSP